MICPNIQSGDLDRADAEFRLYFLALPGTIADPVKPETVLLGQKTRPVDDASPSTALVAQSDGIPPTFASLLPRRSYFA